MQKVWFYCSILIPGVLSFSVDRRQVLNGFLTGGMYSSSSTSLSLSSKHDPLKISNYENNNDEGKEEVGILQETTTNDIYFYGPVSQRSCFELKNMLKNMDFKMSSLHLQYKIDPPPIHLHIQSQGGSLYHTLYIIDLIQNMNTPVYTYVDGFAASAATLISVVGKKRYMTKHSLMLIHQLSGSDSGKFNELQDQMNNMKVLMNIIVEIYLTHTNVTNTTLNYLLQKDLWLDAETCLKYGLVDEII
jgi:ATP-dependent protease ClpP protease subunit